MLAILSLTLASASPILANWSAPIDGDSLPSPRNDSFYVPPANLADLELGEVYGHRVVVPQIGNSSQLSRVEQLAYRTSNGYGDVSHTVALLYVPNEPAAEPKLLSFQWPEDSAELDCAPSYSFLSTQAPNQIAPFSDPATTLQHALKQGWHVVVSDHEGPNSTFLAGHVEGRAGLDGIRAAERWLGWENTPVVLFGYSGGASATVWMANLHASYAPELNIVGAAHGGTPVDVLATVQHLDSAANPFSGFVLGGLTGLLRAYPQVNETVWPHFSANLQQRIIATMAPGYCTAADVTNIGHVQYTSQMDIDFAADPGFQYLFGQESLLSNVSTVGVSVPAFPRYIFHSASDEVIPFEAAREYVAQQCASGANIQWVPWQGGEHLITEYYGMPGALQFVQQCFEGTTPAVTCGTQSFPVLALGSSNVEDVIGKDTVEMIRKGGETTGAALGLAFNATMPYVSGGPLAP